MHLFAGNSRYTLGLPFVALVGLISITLYRLVVRSKRQRDMPPGPPTVPILGNAHQVPLTGMYKQFQIWSKEYGSIFSLKMGSTDTIVLCDREAIHDLLDKKGSIYSERPRNYAIHEARQSSRISLSASANNLWRDKRRILAHNLSPKQLDEKHYRVQEAEAAVLTSDLLESPQHCFYHVRRYAASVATVIVHGFRAPRFDSFWSKAMYDVIEHRSEIMEPGAIPPVDEFPILKLIPGFLAPWKRRIWFSRDESDKLWAHARDLIDKRRKLGDVRDCIADHLLEEYEKNGWPMPAYDFNHVLGEIVEGGADTTASQLLTLILAFAKFPKVQERAREELDRVCGAQRSPVWADFAELPYINAIVKEGMRWRPVAPVGLMHRNSADDWYKGMFIPKNSIIFTGTWAIHHNGSEFRDPDIFNPDRYLGHPKLASEYAGSPDWANRDMFSSPNLGEMFLLTLNVLHHYGYGAGRRVCPGMHMAERSMWRVAAKLLWAFEFSEPVDPVTGSVIPLDVNAYNDGLLKMPLPYKVDVRPRSQVHVDTLKKELHDALVFLERYNN